MTTSIHRDWIASLSPRLTRAGYDWEQLVRRCEQIVLFGSQAAGVAGQDSDFDLLCVGQGPSRLNPLVDLVFIKPEFRFSEEWLGSELAGHIARYGAWLVGEPDWSRRVHSSQRAVDRKVEKILRRLQAVERHVGYLDESYVQKYFALIRRDLQRFEYLINGEPVPSTPLLDSAWLEKIQPERYLQQIAREARVESSFLVERLWTGEHLSAQESRQRLR
nr:nucleotidyltransferase domain-containing protein [Corallococcus coralloides]